MYVAKDSYPRAVKLLRLPGLPLPGATLVSEAWLDVDPAGGSSEGMTQAGGKLVAYAFTMLETFCCGDQAYR